MMYWNKIAGVLLVISGLIAQWAQQVNYHAVIGYLLIVIGVIVFTTRKRSQ